MLNYEQLNGVGKVLFRSSELINKRAKSGDSETPKSFSFSPSQSSYKDSLCHCATYPSSACRDKQQAAHSRPLIFVLITGSKRNRSAATTGKMGFPQTFSDSSQVNLPCSPHSKPYLLRVRLMFKSAIPTERLFPPLNPNTTTMKCAKTKGEEAEMESSALPSRERWSAIEKQTSFIQS